MNWDIRQGDALARLREIPDESVHCCVTSPPYWGLRDYGCAGQIGLEKTPDEFVARLVEVFREARRVLRPDGTCWVNIGDSYAGSWGAQSRGGPPSESSTLEGNGHLGGGPKLKSLSAVQIAAHPKRTRTGSIPEGSSLKPKDLVGVPWMLAFALRADGWYLRSEIIWHKPNPMPESVTDRPTKAHEQVFLFAKSQRYAYDGDAIAESSAGWKGSEFHTGKTAVHQLGRASVNRKSFRGGGKYTAGQSFNNSAAIENETHGNEANESGKRNKRTVWTLATLPTPDAHFATFPIELPETCILAGCPVDGVVLDPFSGAGTTGLAALKHGRRFIGLELNEEYIQIAHRRAERHYPLLVEASA